MLVTRKIPSSYIEIRREGVVCCQDVSHGFQEGVWKVFVVRELHQLQGEENCRCFVIKKLLFSYKARRMDGVSSSGVTLLLQEGIARKELVIRKFYMLLQGVCVWKVCVTRGFHIC